MTKELELSKKLAVLGWILRKGLITEDEYNRTRIHIMRSTILSATISDLRRYMLRIRPKRPLYFPTKRVQNRSKR